MTRFPRPGIRYKPSLVRLRFATWPFKKKEPYDFFQSISYALKAAGHGRQRKVICEQFGEVASPNLQIYLFIREIRATHKQFAEDTARNVNEKNQQKRRTW